MKNKTYIPGSFGEELSYWHYYNYCDFVKLNKYKKKITISKIEFEEWSSRNYKNWGKLIESAHIEISNNNLEEAIKLLYQAKDIVEKVKNPNTVFSSLPWFELGKTYFIKKSYKESKYYLSIYKKLYPYYCHDFIIHQNWESYFIGCLVNFFLQNEEEYKFVLTQIESRMNNFEFLNKLDEISSKECYSYFHFLKGLEYIYKKKENKSYKEEIEKVIKNSPNFFKEYFYVKDHIPEELKATFNLFSY